MTDQEDQLLQLRQKIDDCDRRIVEALAERFEATQIVGQYKAEHGLPARDPDREAQQMEKLSGLAAQHDLDPQLVKALFEQIIKKVRENHKKIKASH